MSDTPLFALEARRQAASSHAQRVLAEARADLAQRESLANEAHAARFRCNESLQSERALFGETHNARQLRLREERIRGLVLELKGADQRLATALAACREARERVRLAERGLLEAESERRALVNVLDARRTAADKQRERSDEDEAADSFRTRQR